MIKKCLKFALVIMAVCGWAAHHKKLRPAQKESLVKKVQIVIPPKNNVAVYAQGKYLGSFLRGYGFTTPIPQCGFYLKSEFVSSQQPVILNPKQDLIVAGYFIEDNKYIVGGSGPQNIHQWGKVLHIDFVPTAKVQFAICAAVSPWSSTAYSVAVEKLQDALGPYFNPNALRGKQTSPKHMN